MPAGVTPEIKVVNPVEPDGPTAIVDNSIRMCCDPRRAASCNQIPIMGSFFDSAQLQCVVETVTLVNVTYTRSGVMENRAANVATTTQATCSLETETSFRLTLSNGGGVSSSELLLFVYNSACFVCDPATPGITLAVSTLTHCGLMTPDCVGDLGQHWFR